MLSPMRPTLRRNLQLVQAHRNTTPPSVVRGMLRAFLAVPLLLGGVTVIYGFGAGYFSRFSMYVPTPLNFIVSLVLFVALLVGVFFLVVPDPASPIGNRSHTAGLVGNVVLVPAGEWATPRVLKAGVCKRGGDEGRRRLRR